MFPLILFWLLAVYCFFRGSFSLLYLLAASIPFGSFAAISPVLTGGLTFTPAPIAGALLIIRVFCERGFLDFLRRNAFDPRSLGLVTFFWLTACVVTFFAPRLFSGVSVMAVKLLLRVAVPLQPTTQNVSQMAYLTISCVSVFAAAYLFTKPGGLTVWVRSMVIGGAVIIVTGLLDVAGQWVNLHWLLDPFRTATYSLLVDNEVLGAKRIVGLMPEASAFGGVSLGAAVSLHFMGRVLPAGRMRFLWAPLVVTGLLAFAVLSTSSAAYVGLGVFAGMAVLDWASRFVSGPREIAARQQLLIETAVALVAVLGAAVFVMADVDRLRPVFEMVDTMVFKKTASSSFVERSMWSEISWNALLETHGFGVGIGSTRASNVVVAVLSNTGFLGGALLYGFCLQKLFSPTLRDNPAAAAVQRGAKWAYPIGFTVGCLVGTSPDFGVNGAFMLAAMSLSTLNTTALTLGKQSLPRPTRRFGKANSQFARASSRAQIS